MSFTIEKLKESPVWVCWKYEERQGKGGKIEITKPPYNPQTGYKAESDNPQTWSDYDYTIGRAGKYDGVGFMFADGICGIDIDNKTSDPDFEKQAETIINLFDTYTETSPSGKGYHIIFKCDTSKIPQRTENDKPKLDSKYYSKNPHNEIECYISGLTNRYFTYTGQSINEKNIEERTEQVLIFLDNYMLRENFKKKEPEREQTERMGGNGNNDLLDKIRKSKQGAKFTALFDYGDIGIKSKSEADQSLCNILAWWLQGNADDIDYYFRQSKLYRDKWERTDYRTVTIDKAIESCGGQYYTPKHPPGRPKTKTKKTPQQATQDILKDYGSYSKDEITIAGIASFLFEIGITVKYNEITRRDEFKGNIDVFKNEHIKNDLPATAYNELKLMYSKCPKRDVFDFIKVISNKNAYNPVLELIEGGKWDGVDRLPDLYCIMRIRPDDILSHILIYKWLWQNISMARNERGEYGADGLLVLQGEQGTGKTTFARIMALKDEWFADGLHLNFSDKDTTRRATSVWIGELGEVSRTFKSDIDALKAFITTPRDIYRLPYGHADEELSRRTSFIGTCNDEHYLIDETGNRRFWTVHIPEKMDLNALEKFNVLQLYLQIYEQDAKNNIQGFRLNDDEQKQLAKRNGQFEKHIKAELEIKDILFEFNSNLFEEMTVSKFKEKYPGLKIFDSREIGRALKKIGVESRNTKKGTLYMLPDNIKIG